MTDGIPIIGCYQGEPSFTKKWILEEAWTLPGAALLHCGEGEGRWYRYTTLRPSTRGRPCDCGGQLTRVESGLIGGLIECQGRVGLIQEVWACSCGAISFTVTA